MALKTFLLLLFFSIIAYKKDNISKKALAWQALVLIIFAGFRDGENMPDYNTYMMLYYSNLDDMATIITEPSFMLISKIANFIVKNEHLVMFLLYAAIGVSMKTIAIQKLSIFVPLSMVIYISNYYILHEMIQIRFGVATALVLLSIPSVVDHKWKKFTCIIIAATFFHYSAIVAGLIYFLAKNQFKEKKYTLIIFVAYLVCLFASGIFDVIFQFFPASDAALKLTTYTDSSRMEAYTINPFGMYILTRIIIFGFFAYNVNKIRPHYKYIDLLLKMYTIGICAYVALSKFPEIAVRMSHLFTISEILIIPCMVLLFRKKKAGKLAVITYAFLAFVMNVLFTTYFIYTQ